MKTSVRARTRCSWTTGTSSNRPRSPSVTTMKYRVLHALTMERGSHSTRVRPRRRWHAPPDHSPLEYKTMHCRTQDLPHLHSFLYPRRMSGATYEASSGRAPYDLNYLQASLSAHSHPKLPPPVLYARAKVHTPACTRISLHLHTNTDVSADS